ncbi:12377_t:CDS:2, partial [Funneliformis mosseae]
DCPIAETTGIDPKALMIEEPKQIEPPSPPKCKLQHCTEKARDNNPYCSNKCFIQGHILEIKKSQDTELVQNQPESSVAESKKTPRVILPKLKSPAIKKAVSIPTKSGFIPNKAHTTSSSDNRPKIRNVFPEKLKGVFTNKYTELGIIGQDYKTKVRSLITSLTDSKNANLLRRILFGDIPPETLVMMSSEELANPEQKALMAKVRRESLQRSILKRENTGPRIKTTHKGELIIVENVRDSPQDSPKDTTTYFEEDHTYANFNAPAVERPKIKFEDLVPKKWIDDNTMASKNENSEGNQLARDISTSLDLSKGSADTSDNNDKIIHTPDDSHPEKVLDDKEIVNSPLISPSVSSVNSPIHSPPNLSCQYSPGSPSDMRFESPGTPIGSPPSNNINIVPETVWRGRLVFDKKLGEFSGHADLLAAKKRDKKRNWDEYLASSIIVNGHVSKIEDVDNYLVDCWCSPNKDIAIIKFEICENPNTEEFETIFNSLHYAPKSADVKKRRYGRVAPAYSTVRDMYLISLEPDDKLPDVITFLELDGILSLEKRPTRLLLGAVIIVEAESNKTKRIHDINEINGRAVKKEKSEPDTTTNLAKVIALPNIGSNIHNNESIKKNIPPAASSISSSTNFWPNQHNSVNGSTVTSATIPTFLQSSLTTNNQNHPNLNINVSQGIQQTPLAQPLPMITSSTNGLYGLSSYPPNPQNPPMQWMPPIQPPQHPQQQVFLPQQGPPLGQPPFMPPPSNIQQQNVPLQYGHHVISDLPNGISQQQPIRQQMPIGSSSQYNAYPQNYNHSQYESPRPQSREKDNRPHWNRDNRPNMDRDRDRNRHNRQRRIVREDRRHHDSDDYRPPPRDPRRPSPPSSDYRDFKRGGGRGGRYR